MFPSVEEASDDAHIMSHTLEAMKLSNNANMEAMWLRLLSMGLPLHPRRRMELRKPSLYLYV
jgi:hypothetical protein